MFWNAVLSGGCKFKSVLLVRLGVGSADFKDWALKQKQSVVYTQIHVLLLDKLNEKHVNGVPDSYHTLVTKRPTMKNTDTALALQASEGINIQIHLV